METLELPTARLRLVLQTPDQVLAMIDAMPPADRAEVSPDWIERVRTSDGDPWSLGFLAVEQNGESPVGAVAFKGPPDATGMVEVAYGIDPAFQRRGYATEAVDALVAFAFASGRVTRVRAHTRPENHASARVLNKCGFEKVGPFTDPVDGSVYRWERRLGLSDRTPSAAGARPLDEPIADA